MKIRNGSDWVIASLVVLCSVVLFLALAVALSGTFLGDRSRIVEADFVDVTGISAHSRVKFAGAPAGTVAKIRILTPQERLEARNPAYRVRLSLALSPSVPVLRQGAVASLSSDTILSDKFVQIEDGEAAAPDLPEGTILTSITPISFDQLIRNADTTLVAVNDLMGGGGGEAGNLLVEIRALVGEAREALHEVPPLLEDLRGVSGDAGKLVNEADALLAEAREPLLRTIARLEKAAASLDSFAARGDGLIAENKQQVGALLAELRTTSQNAKVATTYLKFLTLRLAKSPSQLVWGRSSRQPLPTEKEILSTSKPLPLEP